MFILLLLSAPFLLPLLLPSSEMVTEFSLIAHRRVGGSERVHIAAFGSRVLDTMTMVDVGPEDFYINLLGPAATLRNVPGSRLWVASVSTTVGARSDRGLDLYLARSDGRNGQTVVDSDGDEISSEVSPDGSTLVFVTHRWDGIPRLAHMPVGDTEPRPFGSGRPVVAGPKWSLDGTGVAYLEEGEASTEVCVSTPGDELYSCATVDNVESVVGWVSEEEVLVVSPAPSGGVLTVLSTRGAAVRTLADYRVQQANLSEDGKIVACLCSVSTDASLRWLVFRVQRPARFAEVYFENPEAWNVLVTARGTELSEIFLDLPDTLQHGVPFHVKASGVRANGEVVPLDATWDDGFIGDGLFYEKDKGDFLVHATFEDFAITRSVVVGDRDQNVYYTEDWSGGTDAITARWNLFGTPQAEFIVASDGTSMALLNNDGRYWTGLYTRTPFGSWTGIGATFQVEIPANADDLDFFVAFTDQLDSITVASWQHRQGDLPMVDAMLRGVCSARIQLTEGSSRMLVAGSRELDVLLPDRFELTMRHMIDGFCHVAIDTEVVFSVATGEFGLSRLILARGGGTDPVSVGAVKVWEGVPEEMVWPEPVVPATR